MGSEKNLCWLAIRADVSTAVWNRELPGRQKLPKLLTRKLYKTGQTRGADDDEIYQNRVLRTKYRQELLNHAKLKEIRIINILGMQSARSA